MIIWPQYPYEKVFTRRFAVATIWLTVLLAGCLLSTGCTGSELGNFMLGAGQADAALATPDAQAEAAKWIEVLGEHGYLREPRIAEPEKQSTLDTVARLGGYALTALLASMGVYGGGRAGVFALGLRKKAPD
jgi:hypothetical protein